MPVVEIQVPLPIITLEDDQIVFTTTDDADGHGGGTGIRFDADEPHFDQEDELNATKQVISSWLLRVHNHANWGNLFHPSQAGVLAQYNAQGSITIKVYVP